MTIKQNKEIKKVKKDIKEYVQSEPIQLELFQTKRNKDKYSNTVELYDMMPKYYFGGVERKNGKYLDILSREFECRKKGYKVNIHPAAILEKDGTTKYYYPSQREELVEDALRKFAANKKGIYLDKDAAVKFTLYELQQELTRMGHGYNINEIKQSLEVCNKTILDTIEKHGARISYSSPIFPFVGIETSEGIEGGKNKVAVMFHPLVTRAIDENSYRLVNYERLMRCKIVLSRWWTKRISHYFSQAEHKGKDDFGIKLSTLIRDSGMKRYKKLSDNIIQVTKAIKEMKKMDTIRDYRIEKEFDEKNKRKIRDAKINLYVSKEFAAEIKKANSEANSRKEKNMVEDPEFNEKMQEIRKELENPIYGISRTMTNNIIAKVKNYREQESVINSLAAAKQYILTKQCNAAAVTRTSLRDGWAPGERKKNMPEKNNGEVRDLFDNKEKAEIKIDNQNSIWIKILKVAKKDLDKEEFENWFSKLNFVNYKDNILFLAVESKFLRDNIIRDYLKKFESCFIKVATDLRKIKMRSFDDEHYF